MLPKVDVSAYKTHVTHETNTLPFEMKAACNMPSRLLNNLAFFGKILLVSAFIGMIIAALRQNGAFQWGNVFEGALSGVLIGLGCTLTDLLSRSSRRDSFVRRFPVAVVVLLRATAFSFFIVVGLTLPFWLISGVLQWQQPGFKTLFFISVLIAAIISIVVEITRLLGKEATLSLVTGRYRVARQEDRVVLIADLVGSTALAERIGDLRFHEFLGDVAQDLSASIENASGDVHRYVGDAVIVTWRSQETKVCDASLTCAQDMHRALEDAAAGYIADFGSAPQLRIAIHCGPLAAGEIGDWKKEIALLGDTMNTTARIEHAAGEFGAKIAVSSDFADLLSEPVRANLVALPGYAANGKSERLALFGIK